jgi:hypothetical protein
MLGLSPSVYFAHIACYWKFFVLPYTQIVSTDFTEQTMPNLGTLWHNGSLVIWTVVSLTTAKFKRLIFSVSAFTLSYKVNIFILMILYDFCLSPESFCYIIVYIRKVESCVQVAERCVPWKISSGAQDFLFHVLHFKEVGVCLNPRRDKRKSLLILSMSYRCYKRHACEYIHNVTCESIAYAIVCWQTYPGRPARTVCCWATLSKHGLNIGI